MEDRKRLEEIVNQINLYQGQADIIQQQIETIRVSISDLEVVESTLNNIKGAEGAETLVPVGAGSFLVAELKNTEEVIMSIGAGVAIKKKIKDAKELVAEDKAELQNTMNKMANNLQKISEILVQLSPEADELLKSVKESEG
ncbi:MAG: prefoldin subunit alpha [Euryarchaeota archaeon]|nr:prefoldin subunit alpha [Euryarchaeota archaeon]